MQDLSGNFGDPLRLLVPTSQEGGNMVQPDLAEAAMTAPGSIPATPLPPPLQGANPEPNFSGPQIPVSFPGDNPRVPHGTSQGGEWSSTVANPGHLWKITK